MAVLAATPVTRAGAALTLTAAAAGGDEFPADTRTLFFVRNGSASPITVTLVTPGTSGGLALEDPTVTVPAGGDRLINGLGDDAFKNTNGRVGVTYSAVATVTVGVFQV